MCSLIFNSRPLRYDPKWHMGGDLVLPPNGTATAEDVMKTYSGPLLCAEECGDVREGASAACSAARLARVAAQPRPAECAAPANPRPRPPHRSSVAALRVPGGDGQAWNGCWRRATPSAALSASPAPRPPPTQRAR